MAEINDFDGWICPKCGTVYSNKIKTCILCGPTRTFPRANSAVTRETDPGSGFDEVGEMNHSDIYYGVDDSQEKHAL